MTSSKKRLNRIEQAQREAEILNSQVRMDGVGEDPVIQALVSDEFPEATNAEALDVAMALQELIRGQNSILGQLKDQGERITKLKTRMDDMDKDAERWRTDREAFLTDVQDKADSLKITDPAKKAELIAREGQRIQQEIQAAVANRAVDDLAFAQSLERQPKVTVTSPGVLSTVVISGITQSVVEPEVIRIRNKQWVLPPGVPVDVPKSVADEFYAREKIRQETIERKKILNPNSPTDNTVMAQKWNEISKKYGSAETMISDTRSE